MHVTLVGAGALGRAYGVLLAASGVEVAWVVREARAEETTPFAIERINGDKSREAVAKPARVLEVPENTDAVLVAVRFDHVHASAGGDRLSETLRDAPAVPVVMLTPMLPKQHGALEVAAGRRIIAAMPGIAGYLDERDVVRYWILSAATTLIDEAAPDRSPLEDLARVLSKAGAATRLERDVGHLNAATTISFFPLIAAIDAAGGVDAAVGDKELLANAVEAAKEAEHLAAKIGRIAPWAQVLARFVGPFTLKPGVALAKRVAPEAVKFIESHFGPKLHDQHLAMGEAIQAIGRDLGHPMPALDQLMERVRTRAT
jgi:predicted dinucleotide-binding enzyme